MSLHAQRQQQQETRRIRREQGRCLTCGALELGRNADGSVSKYCQEDAPNRSSDRRHRVGLEAQARPVYREDETYLDSAEFARYCKAVLKCITVKTSLKDIRERMGERFNARRHFDAIENLEGSRLIREEWGWLPRKFTRVK